MIGLSLLIAMFGIFTIVGATFLILDGRQAGYVVMGLGLVFLSMGTVLRLSAPTPPRPSISCQNGVTVVGKTATCI